MWSAYLQAKYHRRPRAFEIDEEDVCYMNALQKIARDIEAPKPDNLVDICGYVRNIEIIRGE